MDVRKYLLRQALAVGLCFFLLIGIFPAQLIRAESPAGVKLGPPDTSEFPKINLSMEVYDPEVGFINNLQASDLLILEDEKPVQGVELKQVSPGVQFVTAINPGPSFAIRDSQGNTRYDIVAHQLQGWAQTNSGATDDLSLLANVGSESTHLPNTSQWLASLEGYHPDVKNATPSFDILVKAIDLASDPVSRPGMKRAVLFVTSPPEWNDETAFQDMIKRANLQDVHIFIWLLGSLNSFDSVGVNQLANLAVQTGGKIFLFSGKESLPDLEEYLSPMRNAYQLSYDSRIRTSGKHQLVVNVNFGSAVLASEPLSFDLNIAPPAPVFVSPPIEIVRTFPEDKKDAFTKITPISQSLKVLVEFPDGLKRSLMRTKLYVDGIVVDENTQSPLDQFTWDLAAYTTEGEHVLRIEVEDALGLVGSSIEMPVRIKIHTPKVGIMTLLARNSLLVAILAIILTGAVLGWVMVLGGRLQPRSGFHTRQFRRRLFHSNNAQREEIDPVTQPVSVLTEPIKQDLPPTNGKPAHLLAKWAAHLHLSQHQAEAPVHAYLMPLSSNGNKLPPKLLAIKTDEVTLGSDAREATFVVNDPSVDRVHARLIHQSDGSFRVTDQNSTAGTWVNYAPISSEGAHLEHGDLLHIGKVGFRFTYLNPNGQARRAVISPHQSNN
jgi:hypothetical protein